MEEPSLTYTLCLKYKDAKPMDLVTSVERVYPISAVLKMMEEYHEEMQKQTKDEFIQKTKEMLSSIMHEYSMCWSNRFSEDDESEENSCTRCGGFTQIEQGGYIVDCTSCKGTGLSNERIFDKDRFIEFMEHTVLFGSESFIECDV